MARCLRRATRPCSDCIRKTDRDSFWSELCVVRSESKFETVQSQACSFFSHYHTGRLYARGQTASAPIQKIGAWSQQIEAIADPSLRASTRELVQLLMEVHGAALDRALEITAEAGETGMKIIRALGRDPVVSSVLIITDYIPMTWKPACSGPLRS